MDSIGANTKNLLNIETKNNNIGLDTISNIYRIRKMRQWKMYQYKN